MAEIGYYHYEGFDLRTKFGWINGAVGIQATEPARIGMGNLGNAFAGSDQGVRDLLVPLGIEWQGAAADVTADSLRKAAERAGTTGIASVGGGTAVDGYGQSFESLRPKVAWQDPGIWDWWEMPVDVTGIGLDAAIGDVFDVQSDYMATIEQNRTLDAQANQALYGHEAQARAALADFPVVESAAVNPAGAAPSGFEGLGPARLGGGPSTSLPLPTGAPEVLAPDRAGAPAPGGAVPAPFGAGPAGAVPPGGVPPGGAERPGPRTPVSPPGGPPPGASGPATPGALPPPGRVAPPPVPARPAPVGPTPGGPAPGGPAGLPRPAVPPAGTPFGPDPGADRRPPGGLDRPAATRPDLAPFPGPVRPSGPGVAPGPGVGPGSPGGPYRLPGDLGRAASPGPGPGPGARLGGGGEFGGRLPGGAPEQAPANRSSAPPGASPVGPRAVGSTAMPFLGGMGAGGGAGGTEHRRRYWIPSSEAFDVQLPAHTEPVIEGRDE